MAVAKEDKQIIKRIIKLFRPYAKKIIAVVFCIIVSSCISMLVPLMNQRLVDYGLLAGNFGEVLRYSIASLLLIMLDQGFGVVETKYRSCIHALLSYHLTKAAFKHTLRLKMQFFNNTNYAEVMSNLGMDIGNISRIADRSTFYIVTSVFRIFGGLVGLLLIDWRLTIVVIFLVPGRYVLVKYLAKKRKELFETYMECNERYSAWYGDTLGGIKEIKLLGIDRIKLGEFIKKQKALIKINIKMELLDKVNEASESVIFQCIVAMLYLLGAYLVFHDVFTVGGLFAFISYSSYVTAPISAILNIGYSFSDVLPSAKRFFGFMDMESEDCKQRDLKSVHVEQAQGNICFEHVTFSYKKDESVIKDISFEVTAGEKVAIIGTNGSGKTTVANLILRIYKPDEGKILLDGMDINSLKLRDYRQLISVVSQDVYLFNTTIKENIVPFDKKHTEKALSAARESGASKFIGEMVQGFESIVGDRGGGLSGGERQKVAMARAFARDSKILVLDEATSNYDVETEGWVNKRLLKGFDGRTVFVITHKPELLENMDKIIVMDNGTVLDMGTPQELSERNKFYREMVYGFQERSRNTGAILIS